MSDDMNNSSWEVKEGKVKIGSEWKSRQQIQRNFIFEIILSILFGGLCVWAFMNNIIFGLVTLGVALFLLLVALGSLSALKALGGGFKVNVNLKGKLSGMKDKVSSKVEHNKEETEMSFKASLSKTTSEERQAVIKDLKIDGILKVDENYVASTKNGKIVGELSKANIEKLQDYTDHKVKCKVLEVSENKSGKQVVKVEVIVIK